MITPCAGLIKHYSMEIMQAIEQILILYFHACACIYGIDMNKIVFKSI